MPRTYMQLQASYLAFEASNFKFQYNQSLKYRASKHVKSKLAIKVNIKY